MAFFQRLEPHLDRLKLIANAVIKAALVFEVPNMLFQLVRFVHRHFSFDVRFVRAAIPRAGDHAVAQTFMTCPPFDDLFVAVDRLNRPLGVFDTAFEAIEAVGKERRPKPGGASARSSGGCAHTASIEPRPEVGHAIANPTL
jgi:hypothetical protein